ncbi:MAG: tetratricopeptide repeat protein [Candidatus Sulfopaludibacter sp.]|nr:tetratricopeptide repeat protein [Candidatus Sulfopaludibacter sp.]
MLALGAFLLWAADTSTVSPALAQHRNLGKAFYENPTTQAEAVVEFKKALDLAPASNREKLNYGLALLRAGKIPEGVAQLKEVQSRDPKLPHTWFNLGIYYKKSGDAEAAIAQFERMIQLVPDEPVAHYQLGSLYKLQGRTGEAQAQFELAAKLDPQLAAARFQLYNLYRQEGKTEDAARALAEFQRLKKLQEGAAIPEDVDWCTYAEIYDPPAGPTEKLSTPAPAYEDHVLEGAATGFLAIDSTGQGRTDLLAWSPRGVTLYRDGLLPVADSGLGDVTGVISAAAGDFNNDGFMDLCILTEAGPLLFANSKGHFSRVEARLPQRRFERAVWIDYDHDYDLDLILLGASPALYRNEGAAGFADRTADFPFVQAPATAAEKLRVVPDSKAFDLAVFYRDHAPVLYRDQLGGHYAAGPFQGAPPDESRLDADFDNDGRMDRATIAPDGKLHIGLNRSRGASHWIRVRLQGIKSLKLAQDAEVEIKAGTLYRKETYAGVPLLFDTGAAATIDVVRITWPNGLIQNETRQAAGRGYTYPEAQRLSGSCPMIWTWNGRAVQFITDVLGVAPLGASDGEGTYFPVDHDEYVSIPGAALAPSGGRYDIRITEELSEVSYLDQVQLLAVDHPAGTEIFTNEKFKGPPYPEFKLFGVQKRVYPQAARDDQGRDALPRLLARDQQYPDQFPRSELGVAAPHTLELDFGNSAPDGHSVLLLNGWVDWPDGSTFRAASQEVKGGLVMPYLQMQDAAGRWKTVNEDMGMPAGKPKTIAVELRFPSASRKLRIVTNLCVYWDEIFLSEGASIAQVKQQEVPLLSADLHFRGFSQTRVHPERKQPDTFFYDSVSSSSFWNPTPGMYTRYGDIRELLRNVDDRLAILGSGDEIRLQYAALAPPPAGWTRDFLLKVDGWAKDRDPNTAFSTSVEPLPFHAMSRYPYPAGEHFPDDAAHQSYRQEYNTRPALRLIRPLGATR